MSELTSLYLLYDILFSIILELIICIDTLALIRYIGVIRNGYQYQNNLRPQSLSSKDMLGVFCKSMIDTYDQGTDNIMSAFGDHRKPWGIQLGGGSPIGLKGIIPAGTIFVIPLQGEK